VKNFGIQQQTLALSGNLSLSGKLGHSAANLDQMKNRTRQEIVVFIKMCLAEW
jgi:hypothetical protein